MPSSRPSMESRPRPSPNNGSSLAIASGVMSSRLSARTISRLSSNSRSSMLQLAAIVRFEVRNELARAERARAEFEKRLRVHTLGDLDAKGGTPLGNGVPGLPLDERDGIAGDGDELKAGTGERRHMGEAALEMRRATRHGARAFREYDEIGSTAKRAPAVLYEALAILVVADVACDPHDRAEERTAPELVLHDALRVGHEGHDQDHVEQRRMVGDDEAAAAIRQPRLADHLEADHPESAKHRHIETEAGADDGLGPAGADVAIARRQERQRNDDERQNDAAHAHGGEGDPGGDEAPQMVGSLKQGHGAGAIRSSLRTRSSRSHSTAGSAGNRAPGPWPGTPARPAVLARRTAAGPRHRSDRPPAATPPPKRSLGPREVPRIPPPDPRRNRREGSAPLALFSGRPQPRPSRSRSCRRPRRSPYGRRRSSARWTRCRREHCARRG